MSPTGSTGAAPSKNSSGEQPIDHRRRAEGPGGIVDQHGVAGDRSQAGADRIRAFRAAAINAPDVEPFESCGRELSDPGRSRRGRSHSGVADQRLDRPSHHRLAAEPAELLGHAAAEALALAGGNDEGGDGHVARASRPACLVRQGLFHYLRAQLHDDAEAHPDRPGPDRRAGDPGADDGRHRPAVPPLVRRYGSGLNVTEMIASQAMIRETRQSLQKALWDPTEEPVSMQLVGCEPQVMAEAAKLNEQRGAAIIDINMGCPVKKVVNG